MRNFKIDSDSEAAKGCRSLFILLAFTFVGITALAVVCGVIIEKSVSNQLAELFPVTTTQPAEMSLSTTTEKPAPTATEKPAPTTTEQPASTATEQPAPTATEQPAPTATEQPAPTATEQPAPTATEKPAPTATEEPAPTTTPSLVTLPMTASSDRFEFEIQEIRQNEYLILLGVLKNKTDELECTFSSEWKIEDEENTYGFEYQGTTDVQNETKLDYPGAFFGLCLYAGEQQDTFVPFELPDGNEISLLFDQEYAGQVVTLGAKAALAYAVTQTPTITPTPTITRTPKPTRTPRPTKTPDPAKRERLEYDEFFDEVIAGYNDSFNLFQDLNQQWVDTGGGIASDDTWAFSVSATTLEIENISHRILRRNYPSIEKLIPFHTELRLSAIRLDVGMNLYRIGLDNFDVDKVEQATDLYLLSHKVLGVLNKIEKSKTATFPLTGSIVVDTNSLNVRADAGSGYDTVDTLSLGNIVPVMRYTLDGRWLEVATFNDRIGWVSTDYVIVQGSDELEEVVSNRSSRQDTTNNNNPQPFTCTGGCATPPDPSCSIKGNVNPNSGTRIYHTRSSSYYNRTNINPSEGDRWFCTTQEAVNAGFRAPNR